MRIALFHNLPSGGAKRTLTEATRRLAAGHHVDAYALSCADHEFADLRPFVKTHTVFEFEPLPLLRFPFGRINQLMRRADLTRLDRLEQRVAQHIEDAGYDVVVVHPCQFEQAPSLLRHLTRIPSVYYCHEPRRSVHEVMPSRPYDDEAIGRRRVLNRLDPLPALYRRKLRQRDRVNTQGAGTVLVNSRFTADGVARIYGVNAQVSYHGVDVDRFRPAAADKQNFVLSVGSLTPLKGFDFLIRVMARYRGASRPPLVIASNFQNAPERAYLEQLAGELGVEVVLRGNVGDGDLVQLYSQAKAVVYAPVREPFGLVPLEAMACAAPVVAVAEGGIVESVVDGETGLLAPRDPDAFADSIQRIVEDPALARRYGDNGRAHVLRHWTWDRAVSALERHLADATAAPSYVQPSVPALAR
jgi:glycosyltransferase involved in cell wall biosynthesis